MCSLQFALENRCKADLWGHCSFDCVACKYDVNEEKLSEFEDIIFLP